MNAGYSPGGFRWFNGTSWVPNDVANRCPNFYPAGTLVTPTTTGTPGPGQIFTSNANPTGTPICGDAHTYQPQGDFTDSFIYNGETYQIVESGFYDERGILADTFWACETSECFGEVRFSVSRSTPPNGHVAIPVMPGGFMLLTGLLVSGLSLRELRKRGNA